MNFESKRRKENRDGCILENLFAGIHDLIVLMACVDSSFMFPMQTDKSIEYLGDKKCFRPFVDVLKTVYSLVIPAVPIDCVETSVFSEVCAKVRTNYFLVFCCYVNWTGLVF